MGAISPLLFNLRSASEASKAKPSAEKSGVIEHLFGGAVSPGGFALAVGAAVWVDV